MRIEIPFVYPVELRAKRARTWQDSFNRAVALVDIPEVDGSELRPVCSVASLARYEHDRRTAFRGEAGHACRVAEIDGRLYAARCTVEELLAAPGRFGETNPFDVHAAGSYLYGLLGPDGDHHYADRIPERRLAPDEFSKHSKLEVADLRDDLGDAKRAVIAARAAELRICGGTVFAPVSAPRIRVGVELRSERDAAAAFVRIDVVETARMTEPFSWFYGDVEGPGDEDATFSLDRADEARAFARHLLRRLQTEVDGGALEDDAVIGDVASGLQREDASAFLRSAAQTVLGEPDAISMPESVIEPYVALRQALGDFPEGGSRVAEALRAWRDAAEADGLRGFPVVKATAALLEHEHALRSGRAWRSPSAVPCTVDETFSVREAEGWSAMPWRAASRFLEAGFRPGADRLVVVRSRPEVRENGMSMASFGAYFFRAGESVPAAETTWGAAGPPAKAMRAAACSHAEAILAADRSIEALDSYALSF